MLPKRCRQATTEWQSFTFFALQVNPSARAQSTSAATYQGTNHPSRDTGQIWGSDGLAIYRHFGFGHMAQSTLAKSVQLLTGLR